MLQRDWQRVHPHDWQVDSIRYLTESPSPRLLLVRKTGEGKTIVLHGAATLLGGVSLCVVPLHTLAADQVVRANGHGNAIYNAPSVSVLHCVFNYSYRVLVSCLTCRWTTMSCVLHCVFTAIVS